MEVWAAYNNNSEIRKASSSGGAFSALADRIIDEGGYVFGASLRRSENGENICEHIECSDHEKLALLRGSKYMPSDINMTFSRIKELLQDGRKVLFCGTPCQVAGLVSFLEKPYSSLVTVDFICHGVPTPELLDKVVAEKENKISHKVASVDFRDKRTGWNDYSLTFNMDDGSILTEIAKDSDYMRMFFSDMYLKPSCYHCSYKGENRKSDITLGDFWAAEQYIDLQEGEMTDGISILVVHSEKGKALLEEAKCELTLTAANKKYFERSNLSFRETARKPYDKKKFQQIFDKLPSSEILKEYEKSRKIRGFIFKAERKAEKFFSLGEKNVNHTGLPTQEYCYGCAACVNICPFSAIDMCKNEFGFKYPKIDLEKCRKCKKCEKVCPIVNK